MRKNENDFQYMTAIFARLSKPKCHHNRSGATISRGQNCNFIQNITSKNSSRNFRFRTRGQKPGYFEHICTFYTGFYSKDRDYVYPLDTLKLRQMDGRNLSSASHFTWKLGSSFPRVMKWMKPRNTLCCVQGQKNM